MPPIQGDTGNGWCENMRDIGMDHVKFICPTAPTLPVSLNHGFRVRSICREKWNEPVDYNLNGRTISMLISDNEILL